MMYAALACAVLTLLLLVAMSAHSAPLPKAKAPSICIVTSRPRVACW